MTKTLKTLLLVVMIAFVIPGSIFSEETPVVKESSISNLGIVLPEPYFLEYFTTIIYYDIPNFTLSAWIGASMQLMKYEIIAEGLVINNDFLYAGAGPGIGLVATHGFESVGLVFVSELFAGVKLSEDSNVDFRYKLYHDGNSVYTAGVISCGFSFDKNKPYAKRSEQAVQQQKTEEQSSKGVLSGIMAVNSGGISEIKSTATPIPEATKINTPTHTYTYTRTATPTYTYTNVPTSTATYTPVPVKTQVKKEDKKKVKEEKKPDKPAEKPRADGGGIYFEADLMSIVRSINGKALDINFRAGFYDSKSLSFETIADIFAVWGEEYGRDTGVIGGIDLALNYFPFGNSPSGLYVAPVIGGRYLMYDIYFPEGNFIEQVFLITPGAQAGYRFIVEKFVLNAAVSYTANIYLLQDADMFVTHDILLRAGAGYEF